MLNSLRINESVMAELNRRGIGKKPLVEETTGPARFGKNKPKNCTCDDRFTCGACLQQTVDRNKEDAKKTVKESDQENPDASEFGAGADKVEKEVSKIKKDKKSEIDDQPDGHDEVKEIETDPTREKLETAKDEADERKGGAAELAADLRVSIRIERMNIGRYKRMLDKHDLSEDGQNWLKEKIKDIQDCIDDMQERIPALEKEAAASGTTAEGIREHVKAKLRKAIVEIAAG